MEKMRNVLDHTLEILSGVSFLAMVVLTCWQVFTRYLLKNPSSWSEELVSYMFGWMALFGASLVTGERGHMNIPLLMERLGPGLKKGLAVFSETVALLFSVVILFYGGCSMPWRRGSSPLISPVRWSLPISPQGPCSLQGRSRWASPSAGCSRPPEPRRS